MRIPAACPTQVPVPASTHKASRSPVILFGPRGRPDKSGWTLEERAVQVPQLGARRPSLYIGPHIELDLDANTDLRAAALARLLTWVTLAQTNGIAAIVVPRWTDYDQATQEMIQLISRSRFLGLPSLSGHHPWKVINASPGDTLRVLHPSSPTKPALRDVQTRRPVFNAANQLAELERDFSADILNDVFAQAVGYEHARRDVTNAAHVAAELQAKGHSNRQIRFYLEIFGFQNTKGVVGRWHDARLAEILGWNPK